MRILLTGAAGFIGSNLVTELSARDIDFDVLDCFDNNLYSSKIKRIREKEITRLGKVFLEADINSDFSKNIYRNYDVIINEAALPGQAFSWAHFDLYSTNNTLGTNAILNAIQGTNTRLIQASTSSVYGKHVSGQESQVLNPCSPYGVSKLAAEKLIESFGMAFGVQFNILRYFSVYGPSQRPDMAIQKFLIQILKNETIRITGDGSQLRDLTFVGDIARATVDAAISSSSQYILNLSGGRQYSILEIVEMCFKVSNRSVKTEFISRPIGDQESTLGDHTAARRIINYAPAVGLEEGINYQLDWLLRHPEILKIL